MCDAIGQEDIWANDLGHGVVRSIDEGTSLVLHEGEWLAGGRHGRRRIGDEGRVETRSVDVLIERIRHIINRQKRAAKRTYVVLYQSFERSRVALQASQSGVEGSVERLVNRNEERDARLLSNSLDGGLVGTVNRSNVNRRYHAGESSGVDSGQSGGKVAGRYENPIDTVDKEVAPSSAIDDGHILSIDRTINRFQQTYMGEMIKEGRTLGSGTSHCLEACIASMQAPGSCFQGG